MLLSFTQCTSFNLRAVANRNSGCAAVFTYLQARGSPASLFSHLHISRAAMNGEQARPSILQHLGILYCRLQLRKQPDLDRNRRFEPRRCCTDQLLHQWLVIHEECTVVATLGDALWATQVQINIVCLIL